MSRVQPIPVATIEPLRALTGLRFVAALVVFVYHVRVFTDPGSDSFPLGPVAVSFFFVLSGFILTRVYHGRLADSPVWGSETRRFLVTRFARLWPLHVLCLLFVLKFGHGINAAAHWTDKYSIASLAANLAMVHSWCPVDHWFLGFNSVSWSIATELFFYLCFPFLFAARRHGRLVLLSLLALNLFIVGWSQQLRSAGSCPEWLSLDSLFISNPLTFLWQFGLGMFIGMPRKEKLAAAAAASPRNVYSDTVLETLVILAIPAVAYSIASDPTDLADLFLFTGVNLTSWFTFSLLIPVFAAAIYLFSRSSGLWARLFGSPFFVWLGEISFAFYMTHQIVLLMMLKYPMDNLAFVAVSFAITLLVSGIIYRLVEIPCKLAILAAWDRRWSSIPGILFRDFRSQGLSGLMWQGGALAAILLGLIVRQPPDRLPETESALRQNQLRTGTVVFANQANLDGYHVGLNDGSLFLELLWTRVRSHGLNRFVNLYDSRGAFIRQHKAGQSVFRNSLPWQMFCDKIVLPAGSWEDAAIVRIGFWDPEKKAAVPVIAKQEGEKANGFPIDLEPWKTPASAHRAAVR